MFAALLVGLSAAGRLLAVDVNEEILPANCDCRDWYGGCHSRGEKWTDEQTWNYECTGVNGSDASFSGCQISSETVPVGQNRTVGKLWNACSADDQRLKFETEPHCLVHEEVRRLGETFRDGRFQWLCLDTGRWVTGCYYSNETQQDVLLKIGETGYNGLIKHVCDRFVDYPGRVQYYAEIRSDVHVKNPTNKGVNRNFPEAADLTIKDEVNRWQHESAALFIASSDTAARTKIRFLPVSRLSW